MDYAFRTQLPIFRAVQPLFPFSASVCQVFPENLLTSPSKTLIWFIFLRFFKRRWTLVFSIFWFHFEFFSLLSTKTAVLFNPSQVLAVILRFSWFITFSCALVFQMLFYPWVSFMIWSSSCSSGIFTPKSELTAYRLSSISKPVLHLLYPFLKTFLTTFTKTLKYWKESLKCFETFPVLCHV